MKNLLFSLLPLRGIDNFAFCVLQRSTDPTWVTYLSHGALVWVFGLNGVAPAWEFGIDEDAPVRVVFCELYQSRVPTLASGDM